MKKLKSILFISHDDSRTGAPLVLLKYLALLKEHYEIKIIIKIKRGVLHNEFSKYGKTLIYKTAYRKSKVGKLFDFVRNKLQIYHYYRIKRFAQNSEVVFFNTIVNGDLYPLLKRCKKGPNLFITYIHELGYAASVYSTKENVENVMKLSDIFCYPSVIVKEFLTMSFKVPEHKLYFLQNYVDDYVDEVEPEPVYRPNSLNPGLENRYVILGCGTRTVRKGFDLFVNTASLAFERAAPFQFIWVGGSSKELDVLSELQNQCKKLVKYNLELFDSVEDVTTFYKKADIFFLSSREDPYPLVMIEATKHALPVVYFKGSGGADEYINESAGIAIDYFNIENALKILEQLINDKELLRKLKEKAKEKYNTSFDKALIFKKLVSLLG